MRQMHFFKTTAVAVALACLVSGCKSGQSIVQPDGTTDQNGKYMPNVPDVSAQMKAAQSKNEDVVGWLIMPNTTINEAVVQTTNNDFYLRRDVQKNYAFEGCYYMDYESVMFDEGADLAQNTIIYGHNLGNPMGTHDDPEGVKFAQLFKLEDEQTAKNTPYIYLVTPAQTHIFEIFAAFYCEERLDPVPYHLAQYTEQRLSTLAADAKARSNFTYDVTVNPTDKLLTLSTCTYRYGTYTQNPEQRYVVMARLMQESDRYRETAAIEKNPNPKVPQF